MKTKTNLYNFNNVYSIGHWARIHRSVFEILTLIFRIKGGGMSYRKSNYAFLTQFNFLTQFLTQCLLLEPLPKECEYTPPGGGRGSGDCAIKCIDGV